MLESKLLSKSYGYTKIMDTFWPIRYENLILRHKLNNFKPFFIIIPEGFPIVKKLLTVGGK